MAVVKYYPSTVKVKDKRRKEGNYYHMRCEVCGRDFYSLRISAKYCTDVCSAKAWRDMRRKRRMMEIKQRVIEEKERQVKEKEREEMERQKEELERQKKEEMERIESEVSKSLVLFRPIKRKELLSKNKLL